MVENDETEKESTSHHRERGDIVRIGRSDEPFVLSVTQRVDRDLKSR